MSLKDLNLVVNDMIRLTRSGRYNGFYFHGTSVMKFIAAFDLATKIDAFVYDATNGFKDYDGEKILLFRLEEHPNENAWNAHELIKAHKNLIIILIGDLSPGLELCSSYAAHILSECKVYEMNGI